MMNIDEIKTVLDDSNVSDYEITDIQKEASELFFVLKKLELNRIVNTENISIKVYEDVDDSRGSSTVVVTSADTIETLKKKIESAKSKARTALNPYFPLVENQDSSKRVNRQSVPLNQTALKVADAVLKADHYKNGWINSTEIFVSNTHILFVNSKGITQNEYKSGIEFEIIPTWSNEKEEYELYKYYESNEFDAEEITKEVEEILTLSKYRSEAINYKEIELPNDLPILMYGEMNDLLVNEVLLSDTSYQALVTQSAHFKKGDMISNTKFSVTLKANIPGVYHSKSFDAHGVSLSEKKIIDQGKLVDNHGEIQFGHYAHVEKPSGSYSACDIECAQIEVKEPHLIIDYFSAPQYEMSGYFGGEVRLARYFDGEKYIPITGLSVSGNIFEAIKDILFSKELTCTSTYKGPKYFIFKGLSIS